MKKFFSLLLSLTVVLGGVFTIFPSQTFAADFKFPEEHQKALEYLNEIRRAVGVREVVLDPYLTEAAQNHANYLKVNKLTDFDYLRRNNIDGHYEDAKNSGFTGETAKQRAWAVGYNATSTVGEVISYGSRNYYEGIDVLLDLPYHRTGLLNPYLDRVGFAKAGDVVVINLGFLSTLDNPPFYVYPYDGQKDVSLAFYGNEIPNPLEQFNVSKTGYVITYRPASWKDGEFESATIKDSKGNKVDFFAEPGAIVHLYPKKELEYGETYTVTVKYGNHNYTWSFTTKQRPSSSQPKEDDNKIDLSLGKQYVDFRPDAYWSENMVWAIQKGLIAGFEEKNPKTGKVEKLLKPVDPLTEAQFLTILFRYSESSELLMTPAKDDKWWASKTYVLAEKLKLPTKGSHSNRKAADAPLTRGEMAVLMASYHNMKYNGGGVLNERQAVQMMYDLGVTNGYPDEYGNTPKTYESYGANNILLREHVVTFLRNYDNYLKSN
jgi:Uncharacterized protein with SCP/PR1 domains